MAEIVDFGLQQHKIKMDSRYFENVLSVVAGDTGRRIEVQLLDTNGMVQNTTGLNLRLNAEIAGKATFTDATLVDAANGKYQLDLSNGMFLAPGNWQFQWQITDSAGKKLHSFAFTGNIGKNISEGGSQATNFYLNLEDLKAMQDDLVNGTIDSSILETNITEKLTDLETQYAPKLTEVTEQLAQINLSNLAIEIKNKSHKVGDKIFSKMYGGSYWEIKPSVTIEGVSINFDDELHLLVNLKTGGTGIAECQLSSVIDYAKTINSKKYIDTFAKLKRRQVTKLGNKGDSITFGQYTGQTGAIVTSGTDTNFGDGSTHSHNQIPTPYPMYLQNALQEVYGNIVTVDNLGYSGDRLGTAYARHRVNKKLDLCTFMYGINDQLYCTSNGANPNEIFNENNVYSLKNFTEAYRKTIVREMLRNSTVVLITPQRHQSLVGYDGTQWSSAKLLQAYENAIIKLGQELGVLVVNGNEFMGSYPYTQTAFDGTHFNDFGCQVMGKRLASVFIGRGYHFTENIIGERELGISTMIDNIEGGGLTPLVHQSNSASFSPPFFSATLGENVVIDTESVYYSFYLHEDKKFFMPLGYIQSAVLKYEIDFGLTQPEYKLDVNKGDNSALRTVPDAFKTIDSGATTIYINSIDDISPHICIQGKGWHSIKISITSGSAFVMSGLRFMDYDVDVMAVVNSVNWKNLVLASGISSFGTVPIQYKLENSVLYFRGTVVNTTYTVETKLFDFPPAATNRLVATLPYPFILTFPWTKVQLTIKSDGIYWVPNGTSGAGTLNTFNIAQLEVFLTYTS